MKKAILAALAAVLLMVITGCATDVLHKDAVVYCEEAAGLDVAAVGHEEVGITISEKSADIYTPATFGFRATQRIESLVEFTVLSGTRIDGVPQGWSGDYHYLWELRINDVLMESNALWEWTGLYYLVTQTDDAPADDTVLWNWPSRDDVVRVPGHNTVILEEGQRYLAFINPSSLDGRIITRINEDRSISPTGYLGIYFLDYDGYTVEQLRELAKEYIAAGYIPWWKTCPEVLSYFEEFSP